MIASLSQVQAALLETAGKPWLLCTGAGVSLASGVPTFRGTEPDAIWAQEVTEKGTRHFFNVDPVASWQFYLRRFDGLEGKVPNAAHGAIRELLLRKQAQGSESLLVTQNIDTLHEQAGDAPLVKVHGSSDRVRCSREGCALGAPRGTLPRSAEMLSAFRRAPGPDTLPRCPACASFLRPHVLWFDERYDEHRDYQLERVLRAAKHARLMIFVGTSFAVGITAMLLEYGVARARVFSIDPGGLQPHPRVQVVPHPAETFLPALVEQLRSPGRE